MFLPAYIMGLGLPELLIILAIILLIFGPKKLPEIGKALGSTVRELRKSSQKDDAETSDVSDAKAEQTEAPQKEDASHPA